MFQKIATELHYLKALDLSLPTQTPMVLLKVAARLFNVSLVSQETFINLNFKGPTLVRSGGASVAAGGLFGPRFRNRLLRKRARALSTKRIPSTKL